MFIQAEIICIQYYHLLTCMYTIFMIILFDYHFNILKLISYLEIAKIEIK